MHQLTIVISLFLLTAAPCFAIEYYVPGDTLWVWAKNGLNIREMPDAGSRILGKIVNGGQVLTLDYQNRNLPYAVQEITKSIGGNINGHVDDKKCRNLPGNS